jgi:hypothetical protein
MIDTIETQLARPAPLPPVKAGGADVPLEPNFPRERLCAPPRNKRVTAAA